MNNATNWTLTAEHRPTGETFATVTLRGLTEREADAAALALLQTINGRLRAAGDTRRCTVAMGQPELTGYRARLARPRPGLTRHPARVCLPLPEP